MIGIIGKKIGMSRIFNENGKDIPVSIIQAGPCVVTQVKTDSTDGYNAIQVGYGKRKEKNTTKPLAGHFKKAGIEPKQHLMEFPIKKDLEVKVGQEFTVSMFKEGDVVDISGVSKGKGFAGVVKRHGFHGGPKTHGQSNRLRAPGSIGQSAYPSRVWPGMKMGGHLGNEKVIIQNLKIVKIDEENNYLFIKGAIPGAKNGIVVVTR